MNSQGSNPFAWRPPVPGSASKTVLLVEDEPGTLRFYQTGLKGLQGWQTLSANNGQTALDMLRQHTVNVMVTDLNMPVMDGYRLIATVYALYPLMPVVVLTSLPEGEPRDRALNMGALRVLSKPVRLSQLMEEIKLLGSREAPGQVKGLGLGGLIQLMAWEARTCSMTIRSGDRTGHLYVSEGQLIHAINEREEGLMAAFQILSWDHPVVEFVDTCRVGATIDLPTTEVLMQLAIFRDHQSDQDAPFDDSWGSL